MLRKPTLQRGSIHSRVMADKPLCVRSAQVEIATAAAGSGLPASRALRIIVTTIKPPAESPTRTRFLGSISLSVNINRTQKDELNDACDRPPYTGVNPEIISYDFIKEFPSG